MVINLIMLLNIDFFVLLYYVLYNLSVLFPEITSQINYLFLSLFFLDFFEGKDKGTNWLDLRLRQFILELALTFRMIPDLNHSPTTGDQWGGDNTRHAVTSQLEIRSPMLCWNNV